MDLGGFTPGHGDSGAQNKYHRRTEHENDGPQAKARRGAAETYNDLTVTAPRPKKRNAHQGCAFRTSNLHEVPRVAKERTARRKRFEPTPAVGRDVIEASAESARRQASLRKAQEAQVFEGLRGRGAPTR